MFANSAKKKTTIRVLTVVLAAVMTLSAAAAVIGWLIPDSAVNGGGIHLLDGDLITNKENYYDNSVIYKLPETIKETDEIVTDAPFLADEVENSLIFEVQNVEDATIITTVAGTTGILAGTYGAGSSSIAATLEDGVLYAIKQIKAVSGLDADSITINPLDMYALQTAKDLNGQYVGGGFFYGAYGNGEYKAPVFLWGIPVFESSDSTQGDVLITAKPAVKVWTKGDEVDVKLYEQNEDDALYNRVTLLGEERLACAVKNLNGVYLLSAE